jgi:very-short-patch-repair endonuclease
MTPTETILWDILRNRKFKGLKFRRQVNIGPYIVDFLCKEYKVVLEVDGGIHEEGHQKEHDKHRTTFLNECGYAVFRMNNKDVQTNLESTLKNIETFIKKTGDQTIPSPPEEERGRVRSAEVTHTCVTSVFCMYNKTHTRHA